MLSRFRRARLRLAGSVVMSHEGGTLMLAGDSVFVMKGCRRATLRCMEMLEGGADYRRLRAAASDGRELDRLLRQLILLNFVVEDTGRAWAGSRFEKQVQYFAAHGVRGDRAQRKLLSAHVCILGLGGIGAVVLQHLLAAGIRSFDLIDHDVVQANNLNRQLIYKSGDVGTLKTRAATDYAKAVEPKTEVRGHVEFIDSVRSFLRVPFKRKADIIAVCADHPVGRILPIAVGASSRLEVPLISGSCGFRTGVVGPLVLPGELSAYRKTLRRPIAGIPRHDSCAKVMSASFATTNTVIGALVAGEIVHFIAGLPLKSRNGPLWIDFGALSR